MSKFQKKLTKSVIKTENALLVGHGFCFLDDMLEVFKTVFVIAPTKPTFKAKNLVYRENFEELNAIHDITAIIFDRNMITNIEKVLSVMHKGYPPVVIEGKDVIEREFSKKLYDSNYRAIEQTSVYHVWKVQR